MNGDIFFAENQVRLFFVSFSRFRNPEQVISISRRQDHTVGTGCTSLDESEFPPVFGRYQRFCDQHRAFHRLRQGQIAVTASKGQSRSPAEALPIRLMLINILCFTECGTNSREPHNLSFWKAI